MENWQRGVTTKFLLLKCNFFKVELHFFYKLK